MTQSSIRRIPGAGRTKVGGSFQGSGPQPSQNIAFYSQVPCAPLSPQPHQSNRLLHLTLTCHHPPLPPFPPSSQARGMKEELGLLQVSCGPWLLLRAGAWESREPDKEGRVVGRARTRCWHHGGPSVTDGVGALPLYKSFQIQRPQSPR